ncbi:hypothetical protein [Desulfosediminicola flagellatus]|uniref:hypothetical protein n=1 Tax=Desulfosediminicola flagellatus TaxID=2569541 RepID=UPI0010AD7259|nr:hypothetical protein [Desulfosediminicola flagellatus]
MKFSDIHKTLSLTTFTTLLFLLLTGFLLCSTQEASASPVSGRYLQTSGGMIKLQVNIGSPAPQSIILEQYLPPGTTVTNTLPKARKIESASGKVIWLFKRVNSGNMNVTMNVSPNSAANSVSGILRYRVPGGGSLVEIPVSR